MKKSEWSDREIERLLRQMPIIQDHRNPRDIYDNLSLKKRKMFSWVLPSIATAAALFLFLILGAKLMDRGPFSQLSLDRASDKQPSEQNIVMKKKEDALAIKESLSKPENLKQASKDLLKSAVYEDEVANGKVITYWIPDDQAQNLIPISTIVQDPENKSWLDIFNEKMTELNENKWGLADYYPLNAEFSYDKRNHTLDVNVPADHQYGQGSANELMFMNIIKKDISSNSNVKKVRLFTNGQPGIEFGNTGIKEEFNIEPEKNQAYFFYYPNDHKIPYLVPTTVSFKTIKEAIVAMKKDQPDLGLKKSMLLKLREKDISIRNKTLYVSMEKNSRINNDQFTLFSFEALLLTAKEFGIEKVVIKNPPSKQIGPFELTKENKVPIAPNLRKIK